MKRLTLFSLTPVLALTALVVPASGADAATPRCQGQVATIVGKPSQNRLKGTPGRDVIVTNGAGKVLGLRGDDLICVTGFTFVYDGAGDDVIDARGVPKRAQVYATLSRGNDTYLGGRGEDSVALSHGGRDRVALGSQRDIVDVRKTSSRSSISLGAGDDDVWAYNAKEAFHVDAGTGADRLIVKDEPKRLGQQYVLDNTSGHLSVDGAQTLSWTGFETFWILAVPLPKVPAPSTEVRFIGGPGAEYLYFGAFAVSDSPFAGFVDAEVDMGGGDDRVGVNGTVAGTIGGGPGRDALELESLKSTDVDLGAGTVDSVHPSNGSDRHFGVSGLENVSTLMTDVVELTGDGTDNALAVGGACTSVVHGGSGADAIEADAGSGCPTTPSHSLYGDDGEDYLLGSSLADYLEGGPGTDVADGRDGLDTCVAETTLNCEGP